MGPLWEVFFSSPSPWHVVAALLIIAASGVFMSSCCAADCEGGRLLAIVRRGRFTSARSVH